MSTMIDFASISDVEFAIDALCAMDPSLPADVRFNAVHAGSTLQKQIRRAELFSVVKDYSSDRSASVDSVALGFAHCLSLKKWQLPNIDSSFEKPNACLGFVERNSAVGDRNVIDHITRKYMRDLLARWLPPVDVTPLPRLGPGAVAEKYDFVAKRRKLSSFASWYWTDCPANYYLTMSTLSRLGLHDCVRDNHVARLCAVPKDWDKDRLITVEPYNNTLLQQAARSYIWASFLSGSFIPRQPRYLRRTWYHFWERMPEMQRTRAIRGSLDSVSATLDLKDASDRISYDLVADVMPAHIMAWLDVSRTPYFQYRFGGTVHTVPLLIYGGMGNATTFLVETLLFLAFVEAVKARKGGRFTPTTVFGDDIICDSRLVEDLQRLGGNFFFLNTLKSFTGDHPCRESCGVLAFNGQDITPIRYRGYLPTSWDGRVALADCITRMLAAPVRCMRAWGFELAMSALRQGTIYNHEFLVPGTPAISYCGLDYDPQELRWNRNLQRREVRYEKRVPKVRRFNPDRQWCLDGWFIGAVSTDTACAESSDRYFRVPLRGTRLVSGWFPASKA
nr:MAG: hypothetical protein 3 [Leviviridae sp.]